MKLKFDNAHSVYDPKFLAGNTKILRLRAKGEIMKSVLR